MGCCEEIPNSGQSCTKRKGCCTAGVWSIISIISGIIFVLIAIVVPILVQQQVDKGICDQVCIPKQDDEAWKQDNWIYNTNRTVNPVELLKISVYNITNAEDVQKGALPILTIVGPYVYEVYRAKYSTQYDPFNNPFYSKPIWNADSSLVSYETQETYFFRPDLSNGTDSDIVITINNPYISSINLLYTQLGLGPLQNDLNSFEGKTFCTVPWETASETQTSCLFQKRTVAHTFFGGVQSYVLFGASLLFRLDVEPDFQIYFNCSSFADCHHRYTSKHNFGLANKCVFGSGTPPGSSNPGPYFPCAANPLWDYSTVQKTGHGSLDEMNELVQWLGNTSLTHVWNTTHFDAVSNSTIVTPEVVRGTDHYQFHPGVTSSDTLTIWDDIPMRHVDMHYIRDTSYLDVDMLRFVVDPALYDNTDPFFFGGSTPDKWVGLLNLTLMPATRYGSPSPLFASRPYQWHADPRLRQMYNCTNCPNFAEIDAKPLDEVGSYLDVEPNTGKVLRGAKRAQVNVRLEPRLFNVSYVNGVPKDYNGYFAMQDIYVPFFFFEDGAVMDQHQADLVKDGLSQIKLAHIVREVSIIVGSVLGGLLLALGFYLAYRFHKQGGWSLCCGNDKTENQYDYKVVNEGPLVAANMTTSNF